MAPSRSTAIASILISLGLSISGSTAQKTDASYVTTTIWVPENYYGPGHRYWQTYASVIAADATATTYQLNCALDQSDEPESMRYPIESYTGCSAWESVTFTMGASTAEIVASNGGEFHMTRGVACKVDAPAAHAQCDFILDGRGAEAMAETGRWPMDPITASEFALYSQAVTITAGVEKIRAVKGNKGASPTSPPTASGAGTDPLATITSSAQGQATGTGTPAAGDNTSTSGSVNSRRHYMSSGAVIMGAAAIFFGAWML
ncbi:hypothetical protein V8F20_009837 [Naviculisporaceae sp. PSN 640]